jgi:hypothetical protein
MSQVGWGKHAIILVALVLNLWVGGDLIELWLGRGARGAFEITLILGYLTLIVGMRAPLPWRRARRAEADEARVSEARETPVDREHDPTRAL